MRLMRRVSSIGAPTNRQNNNNNNNNNNGRISERKKLELEKLEREAINLRAYRYEGAVQKLL
jgi:hypothetical protein